MASTPTRPSISRREQLIAQLEALDEKLTRQCEASLEMFVSQAWAVIEPHTPFVSSWHVGAICAHLEALAAGQIRQLLILVPPRMGKSTSASICYIPWLWLKAPGVVAMYASHSGALSTLHSVAARRVIESEWYQERWGDRYTLTTDQNLKTHFENSERGKRVATSVGGTVTGFGASLLVLDDPHNLQQVYSDADRRAVKDFYKRSWHHVVNNAETALRLAIMQRGHMDDVAVDLIDAGYETVLLPNEYDPKRSRVTTIGWRDPRTKAGELLCPDRLSRTETETLKRVKRAEYNAQYQQDPIPEGGRMFDRTWLRVLHAVPADVVAWVRFWDVAGTATGRGARTAGVLMGRTAGGRFVIAGVALGRWTADGVDKAMLQAATLDGVEVQVREEQEPGSSGKAVIQARARLLAGYDYRGMPATGDKVNRARPLAGQAEAGNLDIVARDEAEHARVREFLDELETFPFGLKDQVDAASGALNALTIGTQVGHGLLFEDETDVDELEVRVAQMRARLGLQ